MTRFVLIALASCLFARPALAELPETRLGILYPPGGEIGRTFEVRISGEQDLDYATAPRLLFSHPGITAEPVLDASTGLWKDKAFRVTATADVPAGRYEARLLGYYGVSNPRSFSIDATASHVESADWTGSKPAGLTVDSACYGRLGVAADADTLTFAGKKGSTVVVRCEAAKLDSPLQPVIELTGPDGRQIAAAGGAFASEAVLPAELPASGEYRIRLTDAAYRGGDTFVYRIDVTTHPVVTTIHPPFATPGTSTDFTLLGYNLPNGESVTKDSPLVRRTASVQLPTVAAAGPSTPLQWSHQAGLTGTDDVFRDAGMPVDSAHIYLSAIPAEFEADNDDSHGQSLSVPGEIAGRFEKPDDVDRYEFPASAGDVLYVEVFAKRYGSQADAVLTIDQIAGPDGQPKERRIAVADDNAANVAPGVFDTATDDPILRFEAPEDGRYRITVRDRYYASRGDEMLYYRLSLRRPRPDFRLFAVPHDRDEKKNVVSPDAINLRKGENVSIPIFLARHDGFRGPVRLTAENLPAGLSTKGATIAEGRTEGSLVLTASRQAATWEGPVKIVGEADLPAAGQSAGTVVHAARAGTVVRGAAKGHTESRLAGPLVVSIIEESLPFRLESEGGELRVGQGSQLLVPLEVIREGDFAGPVGVTLDGLSSAAKITADIPEFTGKQNQQLARITVDPQAPPQAHLLQFQGTAKIDYAAFPHRLARAKASQEQAEKAFAEAESARKQAVGERDDAASDLQQAEAALKSVAEADKSTATDTVEAAKKRLAERETAVSVAEEKLKQSDAARKAAVASAAAAAKESASRQIDYVSPSAPITLTIVPAPADLVIEPMSGGEVSRGNAVAIKVTAKRRDGFSGQVRLSLALPPDTAGLTAEPVTIDAGVNETVLHIKTNEAAAEGQVPFMAIRAEADHHGLVRIDVPVSLTVVP